ncbi:MAG: hypothetical protein LBE36_01805 [Flavobacteriaceae bacterium]|jgi:hypothetical protein|nr:hypothetical protein [Flavobacteriaceae bacterium]
MKTKKIGRFRGKLEIRKRLEIFLSAGVGVYEKIVGAQVERIFLDTQKDFFG